MGLDRDIRGANRRDGNRCRFRCGLLAACWLMLSGVATVEAAQVSGQLVAYEGAAVQSGRFLHFENMVTRDIFLIATTSDGGFATRLPPGVYALRAERGAILARGIVVGSAPIELGQVHDLAPFAFSRLWHRQSIAPTQVVSPAPSTAYILTADTTILRSPRRVTAASANRLPLLKPDLGRGSPGAPSLPKPALGQGSPGAPSLPKPALSQGSPGAPLLPKPALGQGLQDAPSTGSR